MGRSTRRTTWVQSLAHHQGREDTRLTTTGQSSVHPAHVTPQIRHLHPGVEILCNHQSRTAKGCTNLHLHCGKAHSSGTWTLSHRVTQRTIHAGAPQRLTTVTNRRTSRTGNQQEMTISRRMSPPEHRGGNQRPSPQDRRAYQAPQEEFFRTPHKKDVSRRPRRRSSPFCHSLSINNLPDASWAAAALGTTTCVGRTQTCPPLSARLSATPLHSSGHSLLSGCAIPMNKQVNSIRAGHSVACHPHQVDTNKTVNYHALPVNKYTNYRTVPLSPIQLDVLRPNHVQ
jgi:hypothetical protein